MSDISQIDGQSVRLKRETLGLAVTDLATLACLSTKQIKQIEEGGTSAFYSESVKLTAARKIAALLKMSEDQLFGQVPPAVLETAVFIEPSPPADAAADTRTANAAPVHAHHAALQRSEALHFLAQPPEDVPFEAEKELPEESVAMPQTAPVADTPVAQTAESPPDTTPVAASGGSYLLKILALFLVALAVAAVLRPKSSDEAVELNAQESPVPVAPPVQLPSASDTQASATDGQPASVGTSVNPTMPAEKPQTAVTVNPVPVAPDNAHSGPK